MAWTSYDKALRIFDYSRAEALQERSRYKKEDRHPTKKPNALFRWCIEENFKDMKNIKIFDPFMGEGTTAVVSTQLKIDFWGTELDEDYMELIERNIKDANCESGLFGVQGSLF